MSTVDLPLLQVSVRSLVDHVLRAGDLTFEFSGPNRALAGTLAHQRQQSARPPGYQAEVPVSHEVGTDRFRLRVDGRIDGVFADSDPPVIEEIKSTSGDPEQAAARKDPVHWGQAKTYAYCYALGRKLETVVVRLTYCHIDTDQTCHDEQTFTTAELADFFQGLVAVFVDWAGKVADWEGRRDRSIAALEFPFDTYRSGQRRLAVTVWRAIRAGRDLLVQAPTGIGKTLAVLFPAIKAMAGPPGFTPFFLTARTTGKAAAEAAFDLLRGRGLRLKTLTLTAKERICFEPDRECRPDDCRYAEGFFDRLGDALAALWDHDAFTRDTVVAVSRRHRICPFEFSMILTRLVDAVVGDYNYAFDPRASLRQMFEDSRRPFVFLVDEAHNLVERSRDMFSAQLDKTSVLALRRAVRGHLPAVHRSLGRINHQMVKLRRECLDSGGERTDGCLPADLTAPLEGFLRTAEKWLAANRPADFRADLLALYFGVGAYLRVAETFDDTYAAIYRSDGRELTVRLFCLDPSVQLRAALTRAQSTVFFSATLTPAAYFQRLLGAGELAGRLTLPSPFPPGNLGLMAMPSISTRYRRRQETSRAVAGALAALVRPRPGHYLLFFPSYAYMQMVTTHFCTLAPDLPVIVQTPGMSEPEREAFLSRFDTEGPESPAHLVGFAVMGGVFGEGVDLAGERLSGAGIVGVGLPAVCVERELIRRHFDAVESAGFDFAYVYPGINRVLQAAGRVIRSEADRGVVLLLDERYGGARYRRLLPPEWRVVTVRRDDEVSGAAKRFWAGENKLKAQS